MVIGGGGREHAIVWKLRQSPQVESIFVAPGNGGTAAIARNLDIEPTDFPRLLAAVESMGIDLVIVGPEAPLAAGLIDDFQSRRIPAFGPVKAAAQLESSKTFARSLMEKYAIPCAKGKSFSNYAEARAYLLEQTAPLVVKADGLAAGKGVSVCSTIAEAEAALANIMESRAFGQAGSTVVIEECLVGQEMSFLAFTDGKTLAVMPPACDYKRAFDGNLGPNTGGMGAYSPPTFLTPRLKARIESTVMEPVIRALASEGINYRGVIYAGLMLTESGPKVLEFNARFGDPETQIILPQLRTDLVDIMLNIINGTLEKVKVEWDNTSCVTVVMAAGGYPETYKKGLVINGLGDVDEQVTVFHAGTRLGNDGKVVTNGGRVLNITGCGESIAAAREIAYRNIGRITFEGAQYRSDIALFPGS
ncbi:phosphoribosylamine--glycine ligase [Candidatus Dehalogenimonas loeffleri]|uniref:Phosphoribosylamine--glycine ligase n=1 Tax=Candidatus Dehalogenimonas loeffleri TaxID=3127115 RepID=A0ABZ2J5X3_9CHLR